jgi:uncharacterized PurR-regulated membrane protein YhhQ (DUF165 family)
VDSYLVLYIGFVLPKSLSFNEFMKIAPTNYVLKMLIALLLTPLIYLGHFFVRKYLGSDETIKRSNPTVLNR